MPIKIGVVGVGGMGRNHVRVLAEQPEAELIGIYDQRREVAEAVAAERGGVPVFAGLDELVERSEALVLAVPTVEHAAMGVELLRRGKHLLIEKPLAASLAEADELIAARGDRVLAVGHVEFFNPAVQALVELGAPPRFIEIQRLAIFTPRSLDVDVILDLMIHDLQVLHALDPSPVAEVRATGINVLTAKIDIANVRLELASGCVANLTASRVSADRTRKLRAFLPNRYLSLDYIEQEVKGFRLEAGAGKPQIVPEAVPVERREPLKGELASFLAACRGEPARLVSGEDARRALATALAIVAAIEGRRGTA